jgi:sulfatase modifying factor 1
MTKFFITHSWNDIEFAKRLCDDLRKYGLDGFFDAYSIRPGDDIAGRIARGLDECDVYLPLLSHAAVQSKWCELEINAAINLSLEEGRNGRPRIIPLIIAPCKLPTLLRGRLYISFHQRYDDALKQLLAEFGVTVQPPAPAHPTHATPTAEPPKPAPTPPPPRAPALSRDELVHLYNEARALQSEGDLRKAAVLFEKVGDYRDAPTRLRKIQLYLQADEWMKQALADKEERTEPWLDARACLEELLQLDAQFLDARARLETVNRWLALPEAYERLLDALDVDDWAQALPLFEQIRSVKPDHKRTQTLFERAWAQMVQAGVTKKVGKDDKEMMYVPAGEFVMGEGAGTHEVYLDSFYIDRYPVTNAEYKTFVDATKHSPPSHWQNGKIPPGKENHPVVYVSWDDAVAYAQWAGKRLPTEAEWEKAASWDDIKKEKRVYPWGNDFDARKCNSSESGIGDTTLVGKYSPQGDSFYGVADMAGNVWEWCADWYDENYYKNSPKENPKGPASGRYRVLRGGSWLSNSIDVRAANRLINEPDNRSIHLGFRCAQ